MKKWAIIVAGGSGLRMGQPLPKQFLMLADRPLLSYTIDAFFQAYPDIHMVLVLPPDFMEMGEQLIQAGYTGKNIQLAQGGATRFDSVKNGLARTDPSNAIVFVHDGVRCLVTAALIRRCYEKTVETGAVVPAIAANDSIRLRSLAADSAGVNSTAVLNRDRVLLVQTPQTFYAEWLHEAFMLPYQEQFTDEATVVEQMGRSISIVEGEETNIKITRPIDLLIAERYLQQRS